MRGVFVLLFATVSVVGQDPALARLKHEMAVAREQEEQQKYPRAEGSGSARIAAVHAALRNWFEPRLPKDVYSLAGEIPRLEASLAKVLLGAGLSKPESDDRDFLDDPGFDEVGIDFNVMPELPSTLFVTASVKVPCGGDSAVYAYHFDSNGRALVIADHPKSDAGFGAELELSGPDLQGRRLLLIRRTSTQCASSWMEMMYAVYRMSLSQAPETMLSSKHGFWFDKGPLFVLKPDELMIELLDSSVDGGIHNRTYLLRYNFGDGVKRLDPVAFQPQDFAEEWLTAPWSEMQSRSKAATQNWHEKKLGGDYTNVVLCASRPDRWSIGLKQEYDLGKKLEVPVEVHLLVRDLGNYRYEMEEVSDSEFEGCPGEGSPSDKHPWLSVEQLRALP
jgi:hypothetical protein